MHRSKLDAWILASFLALPACTGGDSQAGGTTTRKYVFITSLAYTGNLGGLAGADKTCATLAASAGHAGAWVAWLSDESTDALDRIADVGPWYAMGSTTLVAATKSAFAYTPAASVARDQNGAGTSNVHAMWSGTQTGGTRVVGHTCKSWTDGTNASTGQQTKELGGGTGGWFPDARGPCYMLMPLACIQQ